MDKIVINVKIFVAHVVQIINVSNAFHLFNFQINKGLLAILVILHFVDFVLQISFAHNVSLIMKSHLRMEADVSYAKSIIV